MCVGVDMAAHISLWSAASDMTANHSVSGHPILLPPLGVGSKEELPLLHVECGKRMDAAFVIRLQETRSVLLALSLPLARSLALTWSAARL